MHLPSLHLFIPAFLLTSIGLLITSTVSPADFAFQWKIALFALIIALLISQIESEIIYLLGKYIYWLILIMLLLLLIFGDPIRGSRRWFSLGNLTLQISEFAKLALIIFFAFLANNFRLKKLKYFFITLLYALLPVGLVFLQPDLGSSIIIGLIGILLVLNLNPKKKYVYSSILIIVILLPAIYALLAPYQKSRLEHFINPTKDPLGESYNQIQAVIAVGSGQFIGKGLGKGTQSRLEFLPEKQTDFFFATASEQLGFVGSSTILLLYSILGWNLVKLASLYQNKQAKTVMIGSIGLLFIQPVTHIGINLGLLPVTGIPLPFLSVGGSSLLVNWICIGILAAIEKDNRERMAFEIR